MALRTEGLWLDMSLWYQSLCWSLDGCGDNQEERAKCILSYLSLPVPRSWWEQALRSGSVDDALAAMLNDLRVVLSDAAGLGEVVRSGLLVALPFAEGASTPEPNDTASGTTVGEYLARAKRVLAERPDLARLGELIDGKASPR